MEINKKIEEFQRTEATMSNLIKEAKASEIQEMQSVFRILPRLPSRIFSSREWH